MNKVFVAVIINHDDDFIDIKCFDTYEKAVNHFVTDLQDHYKYNEDCDYMDKENLDEIIEEMKITIKNGSSWIDEADDTVYIIEEKEVN